MLLCWGGTDQYGTNADLGVAGRHDGGREPTTLSAVSDFTHTSKKMLFVELQMVRPQDAGGAHEKE